MSHTDRRTFLSAASAAAAVAASRPAAAANDPVNLDDPAHRLSSVMKIYGATDDRVCMGFVQGLYYGVVDQRLTPLYGVLAAVFNRFVPRADGGYDGAMFEVAYFTDWNTGERLETFKNPYTGETVEVPMTRSGPNPIRIDAGGLSRAGSPAAGSGRQIAQRFLPFRVVHDRVWLVEEIQVQMTPPTGGPAVATSSITNYSARLDDVLNPALKTVPADVSYTALVNWRPWLKMGDRPGYLMGNAAGRTVTRIDDLPPRYVALTRKLHPDVLEDPMALLKTVASRKG